MGEWEKWGKREREKERQRERGKEERREIYRAKIIKEYKNLVI
jgi:hypothetical protein